MNRLLAMLVIALLAGCASTAPGESDAGDDQVRQTAEFIRAYGLESVPAVRVTGPLRIHHANRRYATVETGTKTYLIEVERSCPSLVQTYGRANMGDYRMSAGWLRAGIDTIRDCRVQAIYPLPDETAEATVEESGPTTTREQ